MPRTQRAAIGGIVYHVLNRANARRKIFDHSADYELLLAVLAQAHPPRTTNPRVGPAPDAATQRNTRGLARVGQSTAERQRTRRPANVHATGLAFGPRTVGQRHRRPTRPRQHPPTQRKAQKGTKQMYLTPFPAFSGQGGRRAGRFPGSPRSKITQN